MPEKEKSETDKRNNLKQIITREGITQARLSTVSSVSSGTINKLFNHRKAFGPTTLNRLVNAINKELGENKYKFEDVFPNSEKE